MHMCLYLHSKEGKAIIQTVLIIKVHVIKVGMLRSHIRF